MILKMQLRSWRNESQELESPLRSCWPGDVENESSLSATQTKCTPVTGRLEYHRGSAEEEDSILNHRFKNKLRYLSTVIDKISFNQSAIIYTKDLTIL